jgi:hypothetical protein
MNQALYAHVNNKRKMTKKRQNKEIEMQEKKTLHGVHGKVRDKKGVRIKQIWGIDAMRSKDGVKGNPTGKLIE